MQEVERVQKEAVEGSAQARAPVEEQFEKAVALLEEVPELDSYAVWRSRVGLTWEETEVSCQENEHNFDDDELIGGQTLEDAVHEERILEGVRQ